MPYKNLVVPFFNLIGYRIPKVVLELMGHCHLRTCSLCHTELAKLTTDLKQTDWDAPEARSDLPNKIDDTNKMRGTRYKQYDQHTYLIKHVSYICWVKHWDPQRDTWTQLNAGDRGSSSLTQLSTITSDNMKQWK